MRGSISVAFVRDFRESSGVVMEWGVVFKFTRVIKQSYLILQANLGREGFSLLQIFASIRG